MPEWHLALDTPSRGHCTRIESVAYGDFEGPD
jgi:hypothetical protein